MLPKAAATSGVTAAPSIAARLQERPDPEWAFVWYDPAPPANFH